MTEAARVLLAEDEEHLGAILETFLAARGHRVRRVADGSAAIGLLRAEPFDVALLDVNMPGRDGLDVLRALAEVANPPEAIVMTGNATMDLATSAVRLGAYDTVTKPYRMADVEALVRRAASHGRLRRENLRLRARVAALEAAAGDGPAPDAPAGGSAAPVPMDVRARAEHLLRAAGCEARLDDATLGALAALLAHAAPGDAPPPTSP